MRTVTINNQYPVQPSILWDMAIDYDVLKRVAKGSVAFYGLPEGKAKKGQVLDVEISLLGLLPKTPYRIEVTECDHERMVFRTTEKGSGLDLWRHTLTVSDHENGSLLTDHIEIEGGVLEFCASLWAMYTYRVRHRARLKMAREI